MSVCYDTAWRVATLMGHRFTPCEVQKALGLSELKFMAPDVCFHDDESELGEEYDGPGWYWRLPSDGFLDCTEWIGPFETEAHALADMLLECGDDWLDVE